MKLYTEKEIRTAILIGSIHLKSKTMDELVESLTPIELPSDEEIAYEVITWNVYNMTPLEAFRHGVNWTKERILNQNK